MNTVLTEAWEQKLAPSVESVDLGDGKVEVRTKSQTALVLDRWSLRQGQEVYEESEELQTTLKQVEDLESPEAAAADFFSGAFDAAPTLADQVVDDARKAFMKALLGSQEWKRVRANTMFNIELSRLVAETLGAQYIEFRQAEEDKQHDGDQGDETDKEIRASTSAAGAASKASQAAQDFQDTQEALGCGSDPSTMTRQEMREAIERFRQLQHNSHFMQIMRWAGRYRSLCQTLQRNRSVHGQDEIVGIELGGNLSRLVPSEYARLCDPDLEDDALLRLSQNQCMQRELETVEPVGLGPIVVCCDESGSMTGNSWFQAAGLALAMTWLAREQKRPIVVCSFEANDEARGYFIDAGKMDEAAVVDWLTGFRGGGTTYHVPIVEVPKKLTSDHHEWLGNRLDYLIVTDGLWDIPKAASEAYQQWAHEYQVRTVGILLSQQAQCDLSGVCDRMYFQADLGLDTIAVRDVLSV